MLGHRANHRLCSGPDAAISDCTIDLVDQHPGRRILGKSGVVSAGATARAVDTSMGRFVDQTLLYGKLHSPANRQARGGFKEVGEGLFWVEAFNCFSRSWREPPVMTESKDDQGGFEPA